MVDTAFFVPPQKLGRFAKVYGADKDGTLSLVEWCTNGFRDEPRFPSGDGGLVSTAADYLSFAQMLLNGGELDGTRVLGRRTVRLMMSCQIPQLTDQPAIREGKALGLEYTFGLGGRVLVDEAVGLRGSTGAYGWSGLAGTTFWVDPKENLVGMLLPQVFPGPAGLHEQFRTLVYQALL
jgi:CubicO group peptidase (beta-lactamase class C family)